MNVCFTNNDAVKDLNSFLHKELGEAFKEDTITKGSRCLTGTINGVPIVVTPSVQEYELNSMAIQIKQKNKELVMDKLRPLFIKYMDGQLPICYYETRCEEDPDVICSTLEWSKDHEDRKVFLLSSSNSKESKIFNLEVFDSILDINFSKLLGKEGQILLSPDGYCEGIIGDNKNEYLVFGVLFPYRGGCLYIIPINGKEDNRYYCATTQYYFANADACGLSGSLSLNDSSLYTNVSASMRYADLVRERDALAEADALRKKIMLNKGLLDGDRKELFDKFQLKRAEICRKVNFDGALSPEEMNNLVFSIPKDLQFQKDIDFRTN